MIWGRGGETVSWHRATRKTISFSITSGHLGLLSALQRYFLRIATDKYMSQGSCYGIVEGLCVFLSTVCSRLSLQGDKFYLKRGWRLRNHRPLKQELRFHVKIQRLLSDSNVRAGETATFIARREGASEVAVSEVAVLLQRFASDRSIHE